MRHAHLLRPLCLTLAAQAACVLLGLWIQNRFVVASATWSADKQRSTELAAAASKVLPQLDDLPAVAQPNDTAGPGRGPGPATVVRVPENIVVLLVDPQWQLESAIPPTMARPAAIAVGDVRSVRPAIRWQADEYTADSGAGPAQGTVESPDGPRRGLCYRLADDKGFAVFYRRAEPFEAATAVIAGQLPTGAAIAFVWICTLQGIVLLVVISRIELRHTRRQAQADETELRHSQDLIRTRDAVIFGLAKLTESRDAGTGQHLERIALYSTRLASALRRYPKFRHIVTPAFVRHIGISSALHDIGKVGLEDDILLKPGELTAEQRDRMKLHAITGGQCLQQIEQRLGTSNFLEMAREIAFNHHERWDGSGYPSGLSGERIPLAARIVAIADTYDALSSRRSYKEPLEHRQCVAYISEQAGRHFDPHLVKAFLEIQSDFEKIAQQHRDEQSPRPSAGPPKASQQEPGDLETALAHALAE